MNLTALQSVINPGWLFMPAKTGSFLLFFRHPEIFGIMPNKHKASKLSFSGIMPSAFG
jgi:hypothetical protein